MRAVPQKLKRGVSSHDMLIMIGMVLVVSIATRRLAEWLRVPTILPLLGVGMEIELKYSAW